MLWRGGGQMFVKRFAGLVSDYKKHVQVWNVWILSLLCHITVEGGGGGFFKFRIWFFFFFYDLHLQIIASISPKASVENSSAQWAIFFN